MTSETESKASGKLPAVPRPYYLDMGLKDGLTGLYDRFRFDGEGIPLYPSDDAGFYYNPAFIGNYALAALTRHHQFQRPDDLQTFVRLGRWMRDNGTETDTTFYIPHSVGYAGLPAGWNSCLHQGRLLSVLARMWQATRDPRYHDLCRKSVVLFERPTEQGGVRADFPDGGIGFEEFPVPLHRLALNGMISGMIGLLDFAELGPDTRARDLFDRSCLALAKNIHRYDLGWWSKYSIGVPPKPASFDYHDYHVIQLWMLYEITNQKVFADYARKWDRASKRLSSRMLAGLAHLVWVARCADRKALGRTVRYVMGASR